MATIVAWTSLVTIQLIGAYYCPYYMFIINITVNMEIFELCIFLLQNLGLLKVCENMNSVTMTFTTQFRGNTIQKKTMNLNPREMVNFLKYICTRKFILAKISSFIVCMLTYVDP